MAISSAQGIAFESVKSSVRGTSVLGATLGNVDLAEPVQFAISLKPRDEAGLQSFVNQVNDPGSPNYRRFIGPDEVGRRFGASAADIQALVKYLQSQGLEVSSIAKNSLVIVANGSAGAVQRAFNTHLSNFQRYQDGSTFRTNTEPLQLPAGLASKVVSFDGIDTSLKLKHRATPTTLLNPSLYRACYSAAGAFTSGYYGQGRNIAIANWDGFRLNNLPYWIQRQGLPTPSTGAGSNVTIKKVGGNPYADNTKTPQGEGDLDIQMVLMSAPLANIYVYDDTTKDPSSNAGTDGGAPITTLAAISNDNLADIVTESYGWSTYSFTPGKRGAAGTKTYYASTAVAAHNLHLSMSAQGMTYLAASGDSGTAEFNHPTSGTSAVTAFCYPDIDPEVLMVGGSIASVDSKTGTRQQESSWGLANGWGGTGGYDTFDTPATGFPFNVKPAYQASIFSTQSATMNYRLVPDLASHASGQNGVPAGGTGWAYLIYYNAPGYPVGSQVYMSGTSAASPATAGSLAMVEQRLFQTVKPNSTRSNVRLGRIQDLLYRNGKSTSLFYDITKGTSIGTIPGTTVSAVPTPGWDFATGWGALNFEGLYNLLVAKP